MLNFEYFWIFGKNILLTLEILNFVYFSILLWLNKILKTKLNLPREGYFELNPFFRPCDDDTEKEDFVASWGDDYISDDNSDNFTDEESDSDELF